ncbi:uncharacterized protein [Dermacentor albipictus]|uniref:uncharacterized protein isoform X2 n=1 Tax=Dermacentor albipictus TaxID=60249 RepID=UPI0031FBDC39
MTLSKLTSPADNDQESEGPAAGQSDTARFHSRAHKLATLITMTTGSANAAMFPMMFIFYGGVPFLLAYLVVLATVAMPMLQLESNLAQFAGDGNCGIFSTVPLFLGTGYALTLYVILRVVADSLPLSDVLLQMAGVGGSTVPWSGSCAGGWTANNRTCYAIKRGSVPCRMLRGRFVDSFRRVALGEGLPLLRGDQVVLVPSKSYHNNATGCMPDLYTQAPTYGFRRQQSWAEHTFDNIRAQPLVSVAAIWVLVFALAHGGFIRLKNFFYVMLGLHVTTAIMLLLRALTLEGAIRGLHTFAYADWSHVVSVEMWSQALYTCLESVGVTGTVYLGVQRFNSFKNNFHEDVMAVLVADTASKGICTFMAFLYLGHLSASMGVDVRMLIDYGSSFIVSITPQAVSLAPDPEIWSQVHLLWLLSTMVPKFLIVPDIIIEALSAPYPLILRHRTATHFMICSLMFMISVVGCSSGGASVVSVLAHTQGQGFRLLLVALESVVILQFYGARRLSIDEHAMTNRNPSTFVKICWTSVVPLVVAVVVWGKVASTSCHDYPIWLTFIIIWFASLEFSFIPVFAVTLLECTKLKAKQSVAPLPVRVPSSWEQAMIYRQQIAVEVIDKRKVLEKRSTLMAASQVAPGRQPSHKTRDSNTSPNSDTERMAKNLYVASDRSKRDVQSPSDWRNFSIDDESPPARKSKKRRPSRKSAPETGTLHESRNLSSLRRLARRAQEKPANPTKVADVPLPNPVDKIMPTAAERDKASDESGDSFDEMDFVVDSAHGPIVSAPVPLTDAVLPKPSAKRLPVIVKSFEDEGDKPDFLQRYQNAASGPEPAFQVRPARPTSNLPVATHTSATASAIPAGAGAPTSLAHGETSGPRMLRDEEEAAGRREERQVPSMPPDGRRTPVRRASRKRSMSRRSSTTSQKPGSFATSGQRVAQVPQVATQASSSVASAKAPSSGSVTPAEAAPGKLLQSQRRKVSRLGQTSDKPPSDDRQSAKDHELSKSASEPTGSAGHRTALAVGVATTGGPSDIGGASGEIKQAVQDEPSPAQTGPTGKTLHTAVAASEAARSTGKHTVGVEEHPGKHKPSLSEPRQDGAKSVESSKAQHLDTRTVTAASQPEATDHSKRSGGKTIRSLRKLVVGLRPRSRQPPLSRKSLDSNQSVEDAVAARATDVSAVSAESAAREPDNPVSASVASVAGTSAAQFTNPQAPEIEAATGLVQQWDRTTVSGQWAAADPPPTIVVHKSASQMPAKTTSSGTSSGTLQSSSLATESERGPTAAAARVKAKDAVPGDAARSAGVQSLKESRDASAKTSALRKRRSRRSKKGRQTSDERDDPESDGHQ